MLAVDCAEMNWDFGNRRMLGPSEFRDWNELQ
jgi:hypothetical protein